MALLINAGCIGTRPARLQIVRLDSHLTFVWPFVMAYVPQFTITSALLNGAECVAALRERIQSAAVELAWIPALQKDARTKNVLLRRWRRSDTTTCWNCIVFWPVR